MLAHKMALELGCPSPTDLLDSMTSSEVTTWHAFDGISPIGAERIDYLAAAVMSVIANSNPFSKKKVAMSDFLLKWREDPSEKRGKMKTAVSAIKRMFSEASKHG